MRSWMSVGCDIFVGVVVAGKVEDACSDAKERTDRTVFQRTTGDSSTGVAGTQVKYAYERLEVGNEVRGRCAW